MCCFNIIYLQLWLFDYADIHYPNDSSKAISPNNQVSTELITLHNYVRWQVINYYSIETEIIKSLSPIWLNLDHYTPCREILCGSMELLKC